MTGDITPLFWNCECRTGYIHRRKEKACAICGAKSHKRPMASVAEVLAHYGSLTMQESRKLERGQHGRA